jgi:hypothetical protein
LQEFQAGVGFIKGLEDDNEFSRAAIKKFCDDYKTIIILD